jgi:hypothetical protein
MAELRITTDSTDPADLLVVYQDYSARYERICDDIDALDRQLRHVTDRAEGQRLTAELNALTEDSAVLLGWVAAAFAAYIFTSHGAEPRGRWELDRLDQPGLPAHRGPAASRAPAHLPEPAMRARSIAARTPRERFARSDPFEVFTRPQRSRLARVAGLVVRLRAELTTATVAVAVWLWLVARMAASYCRSLPTNSAR